MRLGTAAMGMPGLEVGGVREDGWWKWKERIVDDVVFRCRCVVD